jgi:hypothetical protein
MGGGGVLGLACRRNSGPPGTAKLEEEARPRRAARLRAAVDDVGEDPARGGRRRAAGSGGGGGGERSEREGERSAEGKRKAAWRGASGAWSRPHGSEGRAVSGWVGPAEDEASRARIRTGPFLSA